MRSGCILAVVMSEANSISVSAHVTLEVGLASCHGFTATYLTLAHKGGG